MSVIRGRYKALRVETAEQRTTIAGYEKSIGELQTKISNLESYAKKLNVMAGLKSPDVLTAPAGIGGGAPDDEQAPETEPPTEAPAPSGPTVIEPGDHPDPEPEGPEHREQPDEPAQLLRERQPPPGLDPLDHADRRLDRSVFGHRNDPFTGAWTMHWGIDISTNIGNPIMATADGIVIKVETDKYLGKNVTISHGNGFTTVYGHMSNFAVTAGQKVKRRDIIGYIGQTGKAAGSPRPLRGFQGRQAGRPAEFPSRRIAGPAAVPLIIRRNRRGRSSSRGRRRGRT